MLKTVTVAEACELLKTAHWPHWETSPKSDIDRCVTLAREMQAGRFNPRAGAPVRLNKNGRIVNGKHRLLALVMTGRPQMLVIDDTRP